VQLSSIAFETRVAARAIHTSAAAIATLREQGCHEEFLTRQRLEISFYNTVGALDALRSELHSLQFEIRHNSEWVASSLDRVAYAVSMAAANCRPWYQRIWDRVRAWWGLRQARKQWPLPKGPTAADLAKQLDGGSEPSAWGK